MKLLLQEELPKIKIAEKILLPEEQKQFKEKVKEELPNITEEQLTFKTLPNLMAETIAKKLNMPVKKLTGAANFTQDEFSRVQNFIKNNVKTIKLALPQAAILKGEAVTEKLIGTATNVPNKLLKNPKLYTRLDRTTKGAGLVPYEKNKNIKDEDLLEAVGIVNNKLTKGPRDPEAQTAKGILNVLGRTGTNQEVRIQGPEIQKVSKTQQTDLRAGVGDDLLFSFNTKGDGNWETNSRFGNEQFQKYNFKIGNINYQITTTSNDNDIQYEILESTEDIPDDFFITDPKSITLIFQDEEGSVKTTGASLAGETNAIKVFSVVANATIDLIKDKKFNSVTFTGKGESRKKLYEALLSKFSKELGWDSYTFQDNFDLNETIYVAYDSKIKNESQELKQLAFSKKKAAAKNNSKLPKSKQLKKGSSNQAVLNEMKLLDEEIKQRRKEFFDTEKLSQDFNIIIENKTGIAKEKKYGDARAQNSWR